MSLADQVEELENDVMSLRDELDRTDTELNEVVRELEDMTCRHDELLAFKTWVELAYPVVVKDYESVKIIEEVANGV